MDKVIIDMLFALLRSGIAGEELSSEQKENITEDLLTKIYPVSKAHDIANIVGYALDQNNLALKDTEVYKKFEKQEITSVYRYENINYEFCNICSAFKNAKIKFIPLKGTVIRKYYPEPWMRTSADIDILVANEDLDRAVECLKDKLEYIFEYGGSHDVSLLSKSNVNIELHYDLIEYKVFNQCCDLLQNVWEYAKPSIDNEYQYELKDEIYYFYHIVHMAKHFKSGGCGIRPFIDLWIFEHNVKYDNCFTKKALSDSNLLKFANLAENLLLVWFNNEPYTDATYLMSQYILTGGVYGTKRNSTLFDQHKAGGRKKNIFSKIFLPYNVIKYAYPILQKHPVLTPVYEIRRWLRLIFKGGIKQSIDVLKMNAEISIDEQKTMAYLFNELGL